MTFTTTEDSDEDPRCWYTIKEETLPEWGPAQKLLWKALRNVWASNCCPGLDALKEVHEQCARGERRAMSGRNIGHQGRRDYEELEREWPTDETTLLEVLGSFRTEVLRERGPPRTILSLSPWGLYTGISSSR